MYKGANFGYPPILVQAYRKAAWRKGVGQVLGVGNPCACINQLSSTVIYNYLNLPQTLTVTAKGNITYTYDAGGNKLLKTTIEGARTTNTLYLGGIIYQNDTLQFIGHEEGRARWA